MLLFVCQPTLNSTLHPYPTALLLYAAGIQPQPRSSRPLPSQFPSPIPAIFLSGLFYYASSPCQVASGSKAQPSPSQRQSSTNYRQSHTTARNPNHFTILCATLSLLSTSCLVILAGGYPSLRQVGSDPVSNLSCRDGTSAST